MLSASTSEAALQAAVRAVLDHPWGDGPRSAHRDHISDAECAVCRRDVAAVLAVALPAAAPLLSGARKKPRIVCPVCGRDVVRRDDGRPIVHYPPTGRTDLACGGEMTGRCRGGCPCKKHRPKGDDRG